MGESSNSKSNELKELLHTLVMGQTQLREDIQQIFQYLLSREPQVMPGGSNTENKVLVTTSSPSEEDQLQMVVKNLLPTYNKHLFAQYFPTFKALVAAGTQIEDALQTGTKQD
jgi:hypothetical protein